MSRQRLIDKATDVVKAHQGRVTYARVAEAVLDAVMPQITTADDLRALPYETLLVDFDGGAPARWTEHTDADDLMRHGPMVVVWQPDVAPRNGAPEIVHLDRSRGGRPDIACRAEVPREGSLYSSHNRDAVTCENCQEMQRHGHVIPRKDGAKAKCGGPRMCKVCAAEAAAVEAQS